MASSDDVGLAQALRRELPAVIEEVVAEIGREVPEYARPLEGSFGRTVRMGVSEALGRFAERVEDERGTGGHDPRIYVGLGRGEFREGRSLNALLHAYRVGARVAWRRLSAAALAAGADGERIAALAEDVFAYIDELSAESAEGYAREQAVRAGETQRLRGRVVAMLFAGSTGDELERTASAVGWDAPAEVAVVVIEEADAAAVARRLGPAVLGAEVDGEECLVLGDPRAPGGRGLLERALRGTRAALGPVVPLAEAARSRARAAAVLELAAAGTIVGGGRDGGLVVADEHLAELVVWQDERLAAELAARALAPLAELPEGRRTRLAETLAAWLENDRQPTPTAAALHLHPQTVRYRVRQLRELFGEALEDPRRRFEIALALRVRHDAAA